MAFNNNNLAIATVMTKDPREGIQQVVLFEFDTQETLTAKLDHTFDEETVIVVPILNVSRMQEIIIREIVNEHNTHQEIKFIDDLAMVLRNEE